MSVINKMLRDLDRRNQSAGDPGPAKGPSLGRGTASIAASAATSRTARPSQTRWFKVMLPGMVAIMALVVWEWQVGDLDKLVRAFTGKPRPVVAPPLPKILEVAAVAKSPASAASAMAGKPLAPANLPPNGAVATPVGLPASAPRPASAPVAAPSPVPVHAPGPASATLPGVVPAPVARVVPPVSPPAAAATLPRAPGASAPSPAAHPALPATAPAQSAPAQNVQDPAKAQQQAIREALAQAQTQWNSGAHEPAIDLLQQALGAAERAVIATPGAATQANLSGIVRELSRMQLAQGRAAAVWDLTLRLEPLLRSDPDVWAIRANATQRLGRHQDSVHAYMTALQTRPTEQRWLLGAAVSMAALGQAGSATEMTDKARAVGPISKDVTTYLRQMGVVVREP